MSIEQEVTRNRSTVLELETTERVVQVRRPWRFRRRATQIAKADASKYGFSANVWRVAGDAWTLAPLEGDHSRSVTNAYAGSIIGPDELLTAEGMTFKRMFQTFGPASPAGDLIASGVQALIKRVAGNAWGTALLAADQAAFPGPVLPTNDYPMDRIAVGAVTYPSNTPFSVTLLLPEHLSPVDNLITLYFGGWADTEPVGHHGGMFALNLRGDGTATLYEVDGAQWKQRREFPWSAPGQVTGGLAALTIQPYGQDRIAFMSVSSGMVSSGIGMLGPLIALASAAVSVSTSGLQPTMTLYRDSKPETGHSHLGEVTGAGEIRLDLRRDHRFPIILRRLLYPLAGSLVDQPFMLPFHPRSGDALTVTLDGWLKPGTALSLIVRDASTGNALNQYANGKWQLVAGQQFYYIVFSFTSDGVETPVLYGYSLSAPGITETRTPVLLALQPDQRAGVSLIGSGADPSTGSGMVVIEDMAKTAGILGTRRRIKARVKTTYSSDPNAYTILHEGETVDEGVEAVLRVGEDATWWQYHVPLTSLWTRISDQFSFHLNAFFYEDEDAVSWRGGTITYETTGVPKPWKITDIIHFLFAQAGVPDDELDIPDLDQRLFMERGANKEDFMLLPQSKFAEAILKYSRDFLDMWVVRDPNAGAYGKWRLLYSPAPPYNPLWTFVLGGGGTTGAMPHHEGAYPAQTSFVQHGTFRKRPVAPEANVIAVVGTGGLAPWQGGSGGTALWQILYNAKSVNYGDGPPTADPDHPDYLGRVVPVLHVDPTVQTQDGVNTLAKRLYNRVAHSLDRFHFRAPLIFVTDPNDSQQTRPRRMRAADAATIPLDELGTPGVAVLRSEPSISYQSDGFQMADYEFTRIAQ